MDIITVAEQIEKYTLLIGVERKKLPEYARRKSEALAEYEKALAIVILKLKNGEITEFEGQSVDKLPATLIEKVAKGICWKERLEADRTEAEYKNQVIAIQAIEAQLNGYQSLNRYLEHEV